MKKNMYIIISSVVFVVLMLSVILIGFLMLYPIKYKQEILTYSKKYQLKPQLVASVINVESGYNPKAISSVGAMGLMQIMPKTAIEIAEKLNFKDFKINDLYNPKINIEFGCYYLNYLLEVYNGNQTNAIAGYNAGLNNVNKWLLEPKNLESGTVENIPFPETDNYVKKINKNLKIYERKFKE